MPWWGKSSSREDKKKVNKESLFDSLHRIFRNSSQERANSRSGGSTARSNDIVSERGCLSRLPSRSPSPSKRVSRCQSFVVRPHAQPLPLPGVRLAGIGRTDSGISSSPQPALDKSPKPLLYLPLPRPGCVSTRPGPTDAEGDLATASVSSDSSIESDEPSESRPLSPLASDCENGNKCAANSPTSVMHKDQFSIFHQKTSREDIKSATLFLSNQILSTSPKSRPLSTHMQNIQIPHHGALCYTPDSTMSSPSRSPMRACGSEKILNSGFWAGKTHLDMNLVDSGHCSSPGSGQNSVGGDMSGQLFWQHNRCSPECSPIPSPRMTSPGPSSRIHSGAVTPIHPQAGGVAADSPSSRRDDGKQQSHRLPLPPITISNTGPFPPAYSTSPTSSVLRSPGRQENPPSPGSRWKKGRLLGRGTFGHVYLGFNRESGEMCAMKEVLLLSDDAKSKESAQQLGQEIVLLSRLRHPNIVQYYGTETVEDKLYIYLEYVSGGSIHKLLQEYGQFGELAIRSYTQQILSGLAYLHAKNTIHRDIKGANLLVDPNGRVKLADFGMAKHISGQPCPLSLKGSPYWMAPEVIRNSSGCNLAVDIWSLGCTVLEMATAKPPWSQYEGVAAMFKIGNSKELPAIPDHLSDEGKDFVRLCLQRNPLHRPTAAQLLEHPFVNNAAQVDRSIPAVHPSEAPFVVTNGVRSMDIGNTRKVTCLESEGVAIRQSRVSKTTVGSSDPHMPRNISCPVSPIGSPLLHSRSPQHMSGRMSPSPISSPLNLSGSSTPITGGNGAIPYHHIKQPTYLQEGIGTIQRSNNSFYTNSSIPYQEPKPDPFRRMQQASHVFRDMISPENATATKNQFGKPSHGDSREFNDGDGQSVLEDRSSQQVLRDHIMLNPSLDLNPSLPVQGRTVGI